MTPTTPITTDTRTRASRLTAAIAGMLLVLLVAQPAAALTWAGTARLSWSGELRPADPADRPVERHLDLAARHDRPRTPHLRRRQDLEGHADARHRRLAQHRLVVLRGEGRPRLRQGLPEHERSHRPSPLLPPQHQWRGDLGSAARDDLDRLADRRRGGGPTLGRPGQHRLDRHLLRQHLHEDEHRRRDDVRRRQVRHPHQQLRGRPEGHLSRRREARDRHRRHVSRLLRGATTRCRSSGR